MELHGIPISPGLAHGRAHLLPRVDIEDVRVHKYVIEDVSLEWQRFLEAVDTSRKQIEELKERVHHEFGSKTAAIFKAHLSILADRQIRRKLRSRLEREKSNIEHILATELERLQKEFHHIHSASEKDHISDITDVFERVLHNLLQVRHLHENPLKNLPREVVVVAEKLIPSDTVGADKEKILAFVTEKGGKTSHVAILARSLGIPAVAGIEDVTSLIKEDEEVLVDGTEGIVRTRPSRKSVGAFIRLEQAAKTSLEAARKAVRLPCKTRDGVSIRLMANVGVERDIDEAIRERAEGIGLFRTEYLYMEKGRLPSEEEQYEVYAEAAKRLKPYPVTIRTLDIGSEKTLPYLAMPPGFYSALGVRGVRFSFHFEDVFRAQLRAILRAGAVGNARVLLPMVTSLSDIHRAKEIVENVKEELAEKEIPYDRNLKIGIMVEVPSVAFGIDLFLPEIDFISIGTNDLLQYFLASDRENVQTSEYCEPCEPSVLRLLKGIVDAALRMEKEVSLCGEIASSPIYTELMLGVGLRVLSLAPTQIPILKDKIRSLRYETCVVKVQKALSAKSPRIARSILGVP